MHGNLEKSPVVGPRTLVEPNQRIPVDSRQTAWVFRVSEPSDVDIVKRITSFKRFYVKLHRDVM